MAIIAYMVSLGFFQQSTTVKKSPVVIVKNFIMLQVAAVAVFFLAAVVADYGEIYEHLPLADSLSFYIAEALGIFFAETGIIFYIFFRWYKEYFEIETDKVVHSQGIIFRNKSVIPLRSVHSVDYRQGPLGRLTKYGAINLRDNNLQPAIVMDHIPEPQKYAELIVQLKNGLAGSQGHDNNTMMALEDLLKKGEHERLELKTSLRWDMYQNKVNKNLEKAVMKTITAFLNSGGGQLIIGADDLGQVIGLEYDYKSLPKQNADGFQNHFTNVFHTMVGPEFRQFIDLSIQKVNGRECCLVSVLPSSRPAYLKTDEHEDFYIRTGNGTTALKLSEMASYIDSHWKGKLL